MGNAHVKKFGFSDCEPMNLGMLWRHAQSPQLHIGLGWKANVPTTPRHSASENIGHQTNQADPEPQQLVSHVGTSVCDVSIGRNGSSHTAIAGPRRQIPNQNKLMGVGTL